MIRRVVLVSVVLLAGCKEAFTSHDDVVARAGGRELTVERLATMLGPAKQVPLRREVVDRVAEMWVDYQLLAQAAARGDSLTDSATIAEAAWPLVAQALANHLHDSLVATVRPSPEQVDSAYRGADHRMVYHILVRVQGDTSAAAKAAKRRQAEGILTQLQGGADFESLARRVSEDPGSRPNGGNLGLVGRGVMVRAFEDAAFALAPGQLSDVVETAFGYHVLWRPSLEQVRDSFAVAFEEVLKERFDSLYLDSLTNRTGISVRRRAPAMVRNAVGALREAKTRNRVIATYQGGRLTEAGFARWLQAFPGQTRAMILQADDSTLVDFIRSIARNAMLMDAARERGVALSAEDWDSISTRYLEDLDRMLAVLAVAPESLATDSTAPGEGRVELAARRVDAYLNELTNRAGARPYVEVPPFLGDVLRSRASWSIGTAGVNRALERAREVRGPETPEGVGGQLTPVPSGPPLPPTGAPPPGQRGN